MEIATEIGADVGNFTPPEEKRFIGIEIMLALGGAMLFGFFKGMLAKIGEKVGEKVGEKIGEPLADVVGREIDALAGGDKVAQEQLLQDARHEVKLRIHTFGLTSAEVTALAQAVEAGMAQALSEKAPEEIGVRIARKTRLVAVRML
jgi:hypothetical protein